MNIGEFIERLGQQKPKAFLFDMDGVLFDSMPNHASSWIHAVQKYGLFMTREEVYMNEGRTGTGTINALAQRMWHRDATDEECQLIYEAKSEFFNTLPQAERMPGAREVLDVVKRLGIQPLIVTGSGQKSLLGRLQKNFPNTFQEDLMVTAFDVKKGKPDPEPYLIGLKKAGKYFGLPESLPASMAVVIENAPLGVRAGKAAGILTVAVNTGPLPDSVLLESGADIVFPSMMALAETLNPHCAKPFRLLLNDVYEFV